MVGNGGFTRGGTPVAPNGVFANFANFDPSHPSPTVLSPVSCSHQHTPQSAAACHCHPPPRHALVKLDSVRSCWSKKTQKFQKRPESTGDSNSNARALQQLPTHHSHPRWPLPVTEKKKWSKSTNTALKINSDQPKTSAACAANVSNADAEVCMPWGCFWKRKALIFMPSKNLVMIT